MIKTALIGNPTSHSVSPLLFAVYAGEHSLDYGHIKVDVEQGRLKEAFDAIKSLGFRGVNVTLPYKSEVMALIDEVDEQAAKIGAVNTVVFLDGGRTVGYNTDIYGAMRSLEEKLGREVGSEDKCLVIGTGGASRAITCGLLERKSEVAVVFRSPASERTTKFLEDFKDKVRGFTGDEVERLLETSNIVYNGSSSGMVPDVDQTPLSMDMIAKVAKKAPFEYKVFMDAIFNPYKSSMLRFAEEKGARVGGGTDWMIYQGVQAFKLWTGKDVSVDTIDMAKEVLRAKLEKGK